MSTEENHQPKIIIKSEDLKKEERVEDVFSQNILEARQIAKDRLSKAGDLIEFMQITNAVRGLSPYKLEWARDGYEDRSTQEWFDDYLEPRDTERYQREILLIEKMLDHLPAEEAVKARVVLLKQKTDDDFETHEYRALLCMPEGQPASYDLLRQHKEINDIMYMSLNSACCRQAIDSILGEKEVGSFTVRPYDVGELYHMLGFDISQTQQNFKYRDANGNVIGSRDDRLYILNALLGGFSNEDDRYLISDFEAPGTVNKN